MDRRSKLAWVVIVAAAGILGFQLFIPPIVGLADQGDFARIIGRFGYAAEDKSATVAFVARKYTPDPNARSVGWEQPSSEYLFAGTAILLNKLFSRDGKLDITAIGAVHALAFLAAFAGLLMVTKHYRAAPLFWIVALIALTDVGYAAYWNSFYAEPASCIFFLLLAAESISMAGSQQIAPLQIVLWSLWAILWVLAKAQNAPLGIVLMLFSLRLWWWTKQRITILGSVLIAAATMLNLLTVPKGVRWADSYNQVFLAILPESKNPPVDLKHLGLRSDFAKYSGTGAWSPGTGYPGMVESGVIGNTITHATIAAFYLEHPTRIWRHAKILLPVAFSLRPEWCGNFERAAGHAPGARSTSFTFWSDWRERILRRIGRVILVLLFLSPILAATAWLFFPERRRPIEMLALLYLGSLTAFLVAALGDAWDNVKHLYLFNLLLDGCMIFSAAFFISLRSKETPASTAAPLNDG